MAYNFVTPDRDQLYLLPPSLTDWLPEGHLAWFVLDCVDEMDLSAFYADYREDGWGGAAHHPKTMVALLVYAYCLGVRSSRQIERACHVDIAFRVICAGLFPDHTTIARFRVRHEDALKSIFTAALRLCAEAGMTTVGLVALDGTKMAANASMSANRTKDTIDEEVDKMFADAKATDEAEDAEFGDARGDEPPATLRGRADRRRRLETAEELLDKELAEEQGLRGSPRRAPGRRGTVRQEVARPKAQGARGQGRSEGEGGQHDRPLSKVMSTAKGFIQGYNAQAVANQAQVIVAASVTDEQNDLAQLHPMIEATATSLAEAGIDDRPDKLLADAGYCSEDTQAASLRLALGAFGVRARAHYGLDALDTEATEEDDPDRMVPNPARQKADRTVAEARAGLARAEAIEGHAALEGLRPDREILDAFAAARQHLAGLEEAAKAIPARVRLGEARPGSVRLAPERKRIHDAIRMATYNAESALARLLAPHDARADDEARSLLREAFASPADSRSRATSSTSASKRSQRRDGPGRSPRSATSSPPPRPSTRGPTSPSASRSRPAGDQPAILAPCKEVWIPLNLTLLKGVSSLGCGPAQDLLRVSA
jgi:transposase